METGHQGEASLFYRYPGMRLMTDEELPGLKEQAGPTAEIVPSFFFNQDGTARLARPLIFKCKKCGAAHTIDSCPGCNNKEFSRGLVQTKPPYAGRGIFCSSCGLGACDFACKKCSEVVPFDASLHTLRLPAAQSESCFIATAAFGTSTAPQVEVLRQFRDNWLLTSGWGIRFVEFYYRHSPRVASLVGRNRVLRWVVRVLLLRPLIRLVSLCWRRD